MQANDRSKFVLTLIVVALATALRVLDLVDAKAWSSVVTFVSSAYMLGQVAAVLAQGWTVQAIAKAQGASNATSSS